MVKIHKTAKNRRKLRVSYKINGTAERPRLSVFRSNKFIYVQAINDLESKTIASANSKEIKSKVSKIEQAENIGLEIGKKLKALKIEKCVYDRGSYRYHGRVKSLADGVRKAGIYI
jgi:large subunit ribosomal protein L18